MSDESKLPRDWEEPELKTLEDVIDLVEKTMAAHEYARSFSADEAALHLRTACILLHLGRAWDHQGRLEIRGDWFATRRRLVAMENRYEEARRR